MVQSGRCWTVPRYKEPAQSHHPDTTQRVGSPWCAKFADSEGFRQDAVREGELGRGVGSGDDPGAVARMRHVHGRSHRFRQVPDQAGLRSPGEPEACVSRGQGGDAAAGDVPAQPPDPRESLPEPSSTNLALLDQ